MENQTRRGMKAKTIKKLLNAKLSDWLKSIEDEQVRGLAEQDLIVTGGCIASMLLGEEVKDFDIYFATRETTLAVAKYYANKFNELNPGMQNKIGKPVRAYVLDFQDKTQMLAEETECGGERTGLKAGHLLNTDPSRIKMVIRSDGVAAENPELLKESFDDVFDPLTEADEISEEKLEDDKKAKYRPIFLSSNAITLSNRIQLVIRFFGSPEEIHKNYDFAHCTNYFYDNELTLQPKALEALLSRELIYQGSKYPICSVIRTRKFLKRGWTINAGQYLKMAFQISQLDLADLNVLEDQLVGVDSAYFQMLIGALRAHADGNGGLVEESYATSIIDKLF